jgi:hypothetical protein
MRSFNRTSLLLFVLSSGALACALPEFLAADPNALATSAAQTVIAAVELTQAASPLTSVPASPVPTATFTPGLPTPIPTQTATAVPTLTVVLLPAQISVSVPTNCRSGPGKVYDRVGALLVGETVPILGREATGMYWYIPNPDAAGEFCWVWGEYATLSGNTAILPVLTPPPTPSPTFTATPSPAFDASYVDLDSCSDWWPEIKLKNTGQIAFSSIGMTLQDVVTSVVVSAISDDFVNKTGCSSSTTKSALLPDKILTVSAPAFTYNPTGHKIRATITLCSQAGQNGLCVTKTITFTP